MIEVYHHRNIGDALEVEVLEIVCAAIDVVLLGQVRPELRDLVAALETLAYMGIAQVALVGPGRTPLATDNSISLIFGRSGRLY